MSMKRIKQRSTSTWARDVKGIFRETVIMKPGWVERMIGRHSNWLETPKSKKRRKR